MDKVYLVTVGIYSDYRIVAIFSTEKKADDYADLFPDEDACVDVWEIDSVEAALPAFRVRMMKNGDTTEVSQRNPDATDSIIPIFAPDDGCLVQTVHARDEQHAVKIMNERRMRLIAENRWGR